MSHAHTAPRRTLIVDDVPGLRRLVHSLLEPEAGYEVVGEAGDGREAVDQARELQPDLVLLDLSMPAMDGLEALPLIRQAAPGAGIVVLSGFRASRMEQATRRGGALGYLEKGLDPETFLGKLEALLAQGPRSRDQSRTGAPG